jgi:hypothetical protein
MEALSLEQSIAYAGKMKLRSKEQLHIVKSLIFHVDRMQKLIKNQRKILTDIQAKYSLPNVKDHRAGDRS